MTKTVTSQKRHEPTLFRVGSQRLEGYERTRWLGESVEEACWRVAGRFQREKKAAEMKGNKWNQTVYNLEIVRSMSEEDSADEQARLASRLRQLFFQWKKANARLLNDPRFVESRKSHLQSDPENFLSLYPAE